MICDSTAKILFPILVTRGSTGSGYCSNARHKCCVCVLNMCDNDVWCLCGWAAKVLQDQLAAQSHATLSCKWQAMLDYILDSQVSSALLACSLTNQPLLSWKRHELVKTDKQ